MTRRPIAFALPFVLVLLALSGRGAGVKLKPPAPPPAPLEATIATAMGTEADKWGVLVVRLPGGQPVVSHNPEKLLIPASNEKVFTTAAALDALGPDWKTRTSVYAANRPGTDGVLQGDLILYGRGDPNLSGRFTPDDPLGPLRTLAARVREAGVLRVEGNLIADESYLSGSPHGTGWSFADVQWYFGAEVSALTFNDNLAEIEVGPGARSGDPCVVKITPDVGYVVVASEATTGGGAKVQFHRDLDQNRVDVRGFVPAGGVGAGGAFAVRKPALYTATAFRKALADVGVEVAGEVERVSADAERPAGTEIDTLVELASLDSLPLSELVKVVNKQSQNLHAELVLRMLGRERGPPDLPSDQAGAAVVVSFLQKIGAFVPGVTIRDGSGLSRLDRTTAGTLCKVMMAMSDNPAGSAFFDSLSQAGVDGTLRHRDGKLDLRAKTGSLDIAKSLSGYLVAKSGQRLAVAFLHNDERGAGDGVGKIDRILEALSETQ
jgi:serine-type D-Ala-D-Ala carboxypeptidase/endopeptidase (penicillin-binding protein 4)